VVRAACGGNLSLTWLPLSVIPPRPAHCTVWPECRQRASLLAMVKTFLLSVGLPLAGMILVVGWKDMLKDKLNIEDRLAILELLAATLTLMAAIALNDTDARSPRARGVATTATIFILAVVVPMVGRQVKRAYRPGLEPEFTEYEARCANALGVWVLSVSYFMTHLPS
jgi:hypothetical protein